MWTVGPNELYKFYEAHEGLFWFDELETQGNHISVVSVLSNKLICFEFFMYCFHGRALV